MLTPRESEIAHLISQAWPDKEIAGRLGVSESAVKNHVKSIYAKLQIPESLNRRVALANLFRQVQPQ